MVTMMFLAGGIITCAVVAALIKGYDARVVLIGSGLLMACIGARRWLRWMPLQRA